MTKPTMFNILVDLDNTMFDILTDSVFEIAQAHYDEAYGGRNVIDFYETPCNLGLLHTNHSKPDAHIEVMTVQHEDLATVSSIEGFGDVYQEGESKSSHTRNPFKWKDEDLGVTGVFGSALRSYGKVMAILNARLLPTRTFDQYFRNEWGIAQGADLTTIIPTLVGSDQMAFAAVVENRTPDMFVHPNFVGDSDFVWHDVSRAKLAARAGRPVAIDFAKLRAYGEFQTRMLRCESSIKLSSHSRLNYHINLAELPPPTALTHFPTPEFSQPPQGMIMELVQSAVALIESFTQNRVEALVTRIRGSSTIRVSDDFGPLDLIKDAQIPTPRVDLSNFRMSEFLHIPADQTIFGIEPSYNNVAIKDLRKKIGNKVVVSMTDAFRLFEIIVPLHIALDMKGLSSVVAGTPQCYRYLLGLTKVNLMGNLRLIGHIAHGNKKLGDAFARRLLNELGFNPVDFHHRAGDDILRSAFSRPHVQEQMIELLRKVCAIRSNRTFNRSMVINGLFVEWQRVGSFEVALDTYFTRRRSHWVNRYKERARLCADKRTKVEFQLRATLFSKLYIIWSVDEPITVGIRGQDVGSIVHQTYINYIRKRMTQAEIDAQKLLVAVNAYQEPNPFLGLEDPMDVIRLFDQLLNPEVTMLHVFAGLDKAMLELRDDVQAVFDEITDDVSEKRIRSAENFAASFDAMLEVEDTRVWSAVHNTTPTAYMMPTPPTADDFDDFLENFGPKSMVSVLADRCISLHDAIQMLRDDGMVMDNAFLIWVQSNFPSMVSEQDMNLITKKYLENQNVIRS